MRDLVLVGVLALALPALPALAEEGSTPARAASTPEAVAPSPETGGPEAAPETSPGATAESAPEIAAEPDLASAEPASELSPVPADAVARGTFATAIDRREPVDSIDSLGTDHERVYYFTELVGIPGRRVTHRWEHDGEVVAEVPIAVGGPRWRAYSSKRLTAGRLGDWTVSVVDETGHVVHTDRFVYEEAAPAPEMAAPAAEPAAAEPTPAAPAPAPQTPAPRAPALPAPDDALESERTGSASPQP